MLGTRFKIFFSRQAPTEKCSSGISNLLSPNLQLKSSDWTILIPQVVPFGRTLENGSCLVNTLAYHDCIKVTMISTASGTEHGKVILWNNLGKELDQWTPHEGMTRAIAVRGDKILSCGGGCVSVIDKTKRVWSRTAWNPAESIAVEWISENQFLVGDYNGLIYLDAVEDGQMRKVS